VLWLGGKAVAGTARSLVAPTLSVSSPTPDTADREGGVNLPESRGGPTTWAAKAADSAMLVRGDWGVSGSLAVLAALSARGVHVEWRFGVYGAERDRLFARSRIVLNVHFYEAKIFEAVRVSYLLANRRFVISERGDGDADFAGGVALTSYDGLVDTCIAYLARPEQRAEIAAAGFALMRERSQAAFLKPVVRRLLKAGSDAPALQPNAAHSAPALTIVPQQRPNKKSVRHPKQRRRPA